MRKKIQLQSEVGGGDSSRNEEAGFSSFSERLGSFLFLVDYWVGRSMSASEFYTI